MCIFYSRNLYTYLQTLMMMESICVPFLLCRIRGISRKKRTIMQNKKRGINRVRVALNYIRHTLMHVPFNLQFEIVLHIYTNDKIEKSAVQILLLAYNYKTYNHFILLLLMQQQCPKYICKKEKNPLLKCMYIKSKI